MRVRVLKALIEGFRCQIAQKNLCALHCTKHSNESLRTKTKFKDIPISKNEQKLSKQYHKTLNRIGNIKNSFLHHISTEIVNTYPSKIVMESFSVESMKKSRHVAKELAMIPSLYEFRFMIEYKCRERGIEFELADKYFPSTQICSCCGARKKIGTSEIYRCDNCGNIIDRDLNAAINLSRYSK